MHLHIGSFELKAIRLFVVAGAIFIALSGITKGFAEVSASGAQELSNTGNGVGDAKASKAADRALRKSVIRRLSRTRGLDVGGINVVAKAGVITLVGTVPDAIQIDLAGHVAQGVIGVTEVRNSLSLQTNGR